MGPGGLSLRSQSQRVEEQLQDEVCRGRWVQPEPKQGLRTSGKEADLGPQVTLPATACQAPLNLVRQFSG